MLVVNDSSEWMNASAPVHARAQHMVYLEPNAVKRLTSLRLSSNQLCALRKFVERKRI
jgi:hypothetical protein